MMVLLSAQWCVNSYEKVYTITSSLNCWAHCPGSKTSFIAAILGILFLISELLGKTKKFESNGVIQAINKGLGAFLGKKK
jgi:hypothetical protein